MPVVIEMNENETAKLENQPMLRRKVCRYPNRWTWAASSRVSAPSSRVLWLIWSTPLVPGEQVVLFPGGDDALEGAPLGRPGPGDAAHENVTQGAADHLVAGQGQQRLVHRPRQSGRVLPHG